MHPFRYALPIKRVMQALFVAGAVGSAAVGLSHAGGAPLELFVAENRWT